MRAPLLAFQIAIERAQPGSVMSGYNKINGGSADDVVLTAETPLTPRLFGK